MNLNNIEGLEELEADNGRNSLLLKWETILGLEKINIITIFDDNRVSVAITCFDTRLKAWKIFFKDISEFIIAHEMGHISLGIKLDMNSYRKNYDYSMFFNYDPLDILFNEIEDPIVNYNISLLPEGYTLIKNEYILKPEKLSEEQILTIPLFGHLANYIRGYLHFKLLNKRDRIRNKKFIASHINWLKDNFQKRTNIEKFHMSNEYFSILDTKLDEFDTLKTTEDLFAIIKFFFRIMITTRLYSKEEIFTWIKKNYRAN